MSRTITKRFAASLGATALLAAGAVALVPSSATAQQACYPPVPQGFNCDGSPASPSPSPVGGIGNPEASPTGSPAASPTGSPTASPAASIAPTVTPTGGVTTPAASPSDKPPPPGCAVASQARANRSTIVAGGATEVIVTGTPNSVVDLLAATAPSSGFTVVRSAELGDNGSATFLLAPPKNTKVKPQQRGCAFGRESQINVRSGVSINAKRNGVRNYTFTGRVIPGQVVQVALFRVTPSGQQVLTATDTTDANGVWVINRKFGGSGKFGFVARSANTAQNVSGASTVRPTVIH